VRLTDDDSVSAFIREVDAHFPTEKPVLIVFDTLSRMMAGEDENGSQAMTAAMANIDRIREHFNCTLLFCHHTTKTGDKESKETSRERFDRYCRVGGCFRNTKSERPYHRFPAELRQLASNLP
jgi:RecA-family ATPase